MATRTLTLRNMPMALVDAIVDFALTEDRTPTAQAERLLHEALTQHGRWPYGVTPSQEVNEPSATLIPRPRNAEGIA